MLIKYNWKKILRRSKGSLATINNILYSITFAEYPDTGGDYTGASFLLHPESLFLYKHRKFTLKEMIDYVHLASLRSYGLYLACGELSLPKEHSPFKIKRLQANKLIKLTETSIVLKLEEHETWH